jgi:hypothetical protein
MTSKERWRAVPPSAGVAVAVLPSDLTRFDAVMRDPPLIGCARGAVFDYLPTALRRQAAWCAARSDPHGEAISWLSL